MVKDQCGDEWDGAAWGEVPTIIDGMKVKCTFNMATTTEEGEPESYFYFLMEEFDEEDTDKGQSLELELTIENAMKIFEMLGKGLQIDINAIKTKDAKKQLGNLITQLQKVHDEMEA